MPPDENLKRDEDLPSPSKLLPHRLGEGEYRCKHIFEVLVGSQTLVSLQSCQSVKQFRVISKSNFIAKWQCEKWIQMYRDDR